jgi:hypothetical protein
VEIRKDENRGKIFFEAENENIFYSKNDKVPSAQFSSVDIPNLNRDRL